MTKSEREIYELRLDNLDRVLASMTTELSTYKEVISAVRKMRQAQKEADRAYAEADDSSLALIYEKIKENHEQEVDAYLARLKRFP